jgi:RHS repeat-associated protein
VKKDANQTESYTYDQVGNRTTSAAAAGDWTYNSNNELLSLPGLNGQSSPTTYQYDANGNTIQKNANGQIQNYVYDVNNRLIQVKDGNNNVIATYTYDPFGRRISKEVSGVKTYFLYSDEGLIGEYDSTGNEIKTYGYKPNSAWSTNPLFMKQGTNYYFYHNDHLGTPQKMTDISGAVVWSATYDAFGKATIDMAGVTNNLRFPGQYYDAETGLHYNGNRYYDANTGRYVTKDPIGFYGGDANLYRYATNDPVNEIDPMGLASRGPCGENTSGYWVGTGIGQDSAQWYADMYNKTGDWYYALGGGLSSLWTPDTWMDTLNALLIAEGASKFLAERAAAEAAAAAERSAANEQVAQVLENKAKGDAFRDEIADLMQKSGRDVQTEVVKDTPFGRRVIDIEVSQDGKVIGGIETKTGNSPYTPSQRAKDAWLGQQGYPVNVVRDR